MNPTAFPEHLVVHTRLAPPRLPRQTLPRPRLTARLLDALEYRLTVVQAGTGYGKSTALAALAGEGHPLVWYHLDADDSDPLVFLLHLVTAFAQVQPDFARSPLATLEEWEHGNSEEVWMRVVDMLVSELAIRVHEPVLLVLDDAHRLREATAVLRLLDRFVGRAPADVHVLLSTRHPLPLPTLVSWRIRGELLEIGQAELAFTEGEVVALFGEQYGYRLRPEEARLLVQQVEGWPIALPLVWQRLRGRNVETPQEALRELADADTGTGGDLFAYLMHEVLAQQPEDIRQFLQETAVLRQMTATRCDCLRGTNDSGEILHYLLEQGLFVVEMGGGQLRYHHLFRELLIHRLPPERRRALQRRAAACYEATGEGAEAAASAIYHLLAGEAYQEAARLLARWGKPLLRAGRLDRLQEWLGSLPPDILQAHPVLLVYLGDIARLHSRFEEALGWYRQAEARSRAQQDTRGVSQALRGQARIYLDTVNPSQAERLLQEALRLSDGQEDRESRARLLELLAENLLNQGRLEQAEVYQVEARSLREQGTVGAQLAVRVLLRTGRLDEARARLEAQAAAEAEAPILQPRAHRETHLLLSLVLAFQGEQEAAARYARKGTERGRALNSPFVTAVGHMRQGHAWLLCKDEAGYTEAVRSFEEAVAISRRLDVPRLRVEASWGLCQAYGFRGELEMARRAAAEGVEIAREAGDEWVEACIRVTMGAAYVLAGAVEQAGAWLEQADAAFRACADSYGGAVTRLWRCLLWHQMDDEVRLERDLALLLRLTRQRGYDYLFQRRTLMGPPDPRMVVPLLLLARDGRQEGANARRLLRHFALEHLEYHPGYRLHIQTLGPFRLWRGDEEVAAGAWNRRKARQLFHLLLTHRRTLLEREQMTEMLWPELDPETAQRDFKIAYSALCRVLEPERRRNAPSAFIHRDGSRYGLRPEADLWLDADHFAVFLEEGDRLFRRDRVASLEQYRQALALYEGEYLQEFPYAEWASEEREHLLTRYLATSERVAATLVEQEAWDEVIRVCQAILERDNCWEQAYRMMMRAYAGQGNRPQALRIYERCRQRLQRELGIAPSPATEQIREQIMHGELIAGE
ncbi:MAG: BTAD domain-containing putative transcriptional regulator [Candidatus Promineifilaceae bacterium]|nr:BTAD domain-containing putative transcriptional regulator [Candidatus Promineifilaceae bacterium]